MRVTVGIDAPAGRSIKPDANSRLAHAVAGRSEALARNRTQCDQDITSASGLDSLLDGLPRRAVLRS